MCVRLCAVSWGLRRSPSRTVLLLCWLICVIVRGSSVPIESLHQMAKQHYLNEPQYRQYHFDRPSRLNSGTVQALDHGPKWHSESSGLFDDDAFETAEDGKGHQSITDTELRPETNTVEQDDESNQPLVDHGSSGQDFTDADFESEVASHLEPRSRKRRLRFEDDNASQMISPHQNFAIGARIGDLSRLQITARTPSEERNELDSQMVHEANRQPLVGGPDDQTKWQTHHGESHANATLKPVTNASNEPALPVATQATHRTEPGNYYSMPVAIGHTVANSSDVEQQGPSNQSHDASEPDSWKVARAPQPKSIENTRDDSTSSLMTQGYSNRDRGFGFIKAWAWDRSEKYKVKNADQRRGHSSTGKQLD